MLQKRTGRHHLSCVVVAKVSYAAAAAPTATTITNKQQLYRTNNNTNLSNIQLRQSHFCFELPSVMLQKRTEK